MNMISRPATTSTLPPIVHPLVTRYLEHHQQKLMPLTLQFGCGLHILFPEIAEDTFAKMRATFEERGLEYQIHYAAKVNRSNAFIDAALKTGCGLDLASLKELEDALSRGASGTDLCLSGPFKCDHTISLASRSGALLTVDSMEELIRLSQGNWGPLRILLRWSGETKRLSRFGLSKEQLTEAFRLCGAAKMLTLHGLSFHLSGYNLEDRACSIETSIELITSNRIHFADNLIVNMGGGLPIRYMEAKDWLEVQKLTPESFWHGKKALGTYPAFSDTAGKDALAAILDWPCQVTPNETITDLARRTGIKLIVEPGRAALDQAGISVFPVVSTKRLDHNRLSVCLLGNSLSLSERWFNCEIMTDPILLTVGCKEKKNFRDDLCLLSGASCLEDDVFSWRWMNLRATPAPGDQVVFINTAPYQMDFAETAIHRASLPVKIVITDASTFEWKVEK